MNRAKVLQELRAGRALLDRAIQGLEDLERGFKRRGRPRGSKNKPHAKKGSGTS